MDAPEVTLEDVARAAGVHRSTVALALRNNSRISVGTRKRVRALSKKLGYRLNPLVAALMHTRRTAASSCQEVLAFVTNHRTRYGWRHECHNSPDFFPGAAECARDLGYVLEHFWLGGPGMTLKRFDRALSSRRIRGLIFAGMPPEKRLLGLQWNRLSAVALGMSLESPRLHRVTERHFDAAWLAMQRCREFGYRRVGFVFTDADDSPRASDRWVGAYFTQQLYHLHPDRIPICPGVPADEKAFGSWFREHRPDALLATHSAPVLGWLATMGYDVPRDVGVVELQGYMNENASGIFYNAAKMGSLAVERLSALLQYNEVGIPQEPCDILVSGTWQEGATLARHSENSISGKEGGKVRLAVVGNTV